jgi:hypothetical protein
MHDVVCSAQQELEPRYLSLRQQSLVLIHVVQSPATLLTSYCLLLNYSAYLLPLSLFRGFYNTKLCPQDTIASE